MQTISLNKVSEYCESLILAANFSNVDRPSCSYREPRSQADLGVVMPLASSVHVCRKLGKVQRAEAGLSSQPNTLEVST
jgi:hypothetical protein